MRQVRVDPECDTGSVKFPLSDAIPFESLEGVSPP